MPPKRATGAKRGRPSKSSAATSASRPRHSAKSPDPFASSDEDRTREAVDLLGSDNEDNESGVGRVSNTGGARSRPRAGANAGSGSGSGDGDGEIIDLDRESVPRRKNVDDDEPPPEKTIPSGLLARILQEGFQKDGTRLTGDAARATSKYMDVFVREAIARCSHERDSGFLEVEDLEKIAPQLLMDF